MPDLSIIIPACNEAAAIGAVLDELHALELEDYEILVVDDGSADDTSAVAQEHGARVARHPYNIGNGAAVKTGLRNARGRRVVLMDADGQHRPADVPTLLRELDEYHMVIGARDNAGQAGLPRLLANRLYNGLASYVTEFPVKDLTSGMRAIRRAEALRFIDLLPNTFSYPATITLAFLRSGLTVKYVPVTMPPRVGTSKLRPLKDGMRFLLIISRIATLFAPFRVFLPLSAAFFVTGCGYYLYTFMFQNRFTNMGMLLFIAAILVFLMGLVSEQIAMLRMERLGGSHAPDDELVNRPD